MKKIILIIILFVTLNANAIKVKFMVANTSVNVAEGSTGIYTAFELYPNEYVGSDTNNIRDLVDFPSINYEDLAEVIIEKMDLSFTDPAFNIVDSFSVSEIFSYGYYDDKSTIQGESYVYRLTLITKTGQKLILFNKTITSTIAQPQMNCAKLNNIYRLAGHNNFQESIISPGNGGFYKTLDFTRVVELDIHGDSPFGAWEWEVRHVGSGNKNNCGHGTTGDKPFGFCLNDLKDWHNNNPNHDVIILFIDVKSKWDDNKGHGPEDLDNILLSLVPNADMIYKPRDMVGYGNFGNMRLAAQQNNWPSMGDLTGKFMFVLTGSGGRISEYIANRSLNAVAFSAAKVKTPIDALTLPDIWPGLKDDIVFYNMQQFCNVPFNFQCGSDADFNTGFTVSNLGYISRTYGIELFGEPGVYFNSDFQHALDFSMNNVAVANILTPNFFLNMQVNGIQYPPATVDSYINNDHIYSSYANVTQAATNTIKASNLTVESGTHYRMMAGNNIKLQSGVHIKAGSHTKIRIDNCEGANYNLRPAVTGISLSQEEIDAIMHGLDKELYSYQPSDENEVVNLAVYPNPTTDIINISYTNYLLNEAVFTLVDLTGRIVLSKNYENQQEGAQKFSINISNLQEGTYFYTLQVGEQTYNGKVVKMEQ